MAAWKRSIVMACVGVSLLGGCQNGMNNEQQGTLLGAGGGAVLGATIGGLAGHNAGSAALGGVLGALAGGITGNLIGRQLDERDRIIAAQATRQALMAPVVYSPNPNVAPRPPARPAVWHSNHSGVSGSATVTAVQREASGGECRNVREVAVIKGEEVVQNSRYCRDPAGEWRSA